MTELLISIFTKFSRKMDMLCPGSLCRTRMSDNIRTIIIQKVRKAKYFVTMFNSILDISQAD